MTPSFPLKNRCFYTTSTHQYYRPHPLLQPYIAHYTLFYPAPHAPSLTLIPDVSGCVVLPFTTPERKGHLWGGTTQLVEVDQHQSEPLFFIEFLPGGAYYLTHIPQTLITDKKIMLDAILPHWQQFFDQQVSCSSLSSFLEHLDAFLITQQHLDAYHMFMKDALHTLDTKEDLTKICNYSQRHINRLFQQTLGVSTKTYTRLRRVNHAIELLKTTDTSLTQLAQQVGYYDQAHFNHDFKRVCEVTPNDYKRQMSIFYNESFKLTDILK